MSNHTIYSIPKVKANAIAATVKHSTAESANPYPADSPAGIIFVRTFNKERRRQKDAITAQEKPNTDAISTAAAQVKAAITDLPVLIGEYAANS